MLDVYPSWDVVSNDVWSYPKYMGILNVVVAWPAPEFPLWEMDDEALYLVTTLLALHLVTSL